MREQNRLIALLAVAGFAGTALAGNPTLILDDFDADPNDDAGGPRAVSTTIFGGSGSFGGTHRFDIVTDTIYAGDEGSAVFESGVGINLSGTIRWDNDGAGLALDAAALGLVGFELDFAVIDQNFNIELRIEDGDGTTSIATANTDALNLSGNSVRTDSYSLDLFDLTDFDMTNVAAIQITFNTRSGVVDGLDFAATEFRAVVPTPGPLALLALGGVVCTVRRR